MNKRGFEFSFAWIFAIIVGAVIIFLAIYSTSRIVNTEREVINTEIGREIGILLSPIETNLEDAKKAKIIMPSESRIFNICDSSGNFGSQEIGVSTRSGIGEEYQLSGVRSSFHNKYIFSSNAIEGQEINVFSKPFDMPFKVASLIYIWPDNEEYCFVDPPNYVKDELSDLDFSGIQITSSLSSCNPESKKVCFIGTGCDIDVSLDFNNPESGSVRKKFTDAVYFSNPSLLYGAIFADSGIYECQVKRLMKRTSELSGLYLEKSEYLTPKGCSSGTLQPELINYAEKTLGLESSLDLKEIRDDSKNLGRQNDLLSCELF